MDKDEMMTIAEELVKYAKGKVDQAEFFIQYGKGSGISVKGGSISYSSGGEDFGVGIRVINKGKLGFSYSDLKNAKKGLGLAKKLSRMSKKIDHEFTQPGRYKKVPGMFNKKILKVEPEDGIDMVKSLVNQTQGYKKGIKVTSGGVGWSWGTDVVANTNGVLCANEETGISASVACTYAYKGQMSSGGWYEHSRKNDLDLDHISHMAASVAYDSRNPKPLKKDGQMDVVLSNDAFSELIEYTVIPSLYGENIHRGESMYSDKKGETVGVRSLSLIEDPLDPKGSISGPCDDEGVPSKKTELIKNGKLLTELYDTNAARKYETKPTSNGVRTQRLAGSQSFRYQPTTAARNLVFNSKGKGKMDKVISQIDKGIFVWDVLGAHTSNPTSGDFSVMSSVLFRVSKGELREPLGSVMISGNAGQMLKDLIFMGSDHRYLSGSLSYVGTCVPTTAVGGLTVTK